MFLKYNSLTIGWALLILVSVIVPAGILSNSPGFWFIGTDKMAHIFLYMVFSLLMVIGFVKQSQYLYLTKKAMALTAIICFTYGVLMEFLQLPLPKRNFELLDILANATGIALGIGIYWFFYRVKV